MRLYNYLNEEKSIDKIKRMSEPFFKEFGDAYMSNDFIWRGHRSAVNDFKTKQRRKNRKPRMIDTELHEYLDNISQELFNWPVRSQGVFCGGYGLASEWGVPYIFIPLGDYKYIWTTEYTDIYELYDDFDQTFEEDIKDRLYQLYKNLYKTSELSKAVEQGADFEAIFDCDFYLLVNSSYWETLKEQLFN